MFQKRHEMKVDSWIGRGADSGLLSFYGVRPGSKVALKVSDSGSLG